MSIWPDVWPPGTAGSGCTGESKQLYIPRTFFHCPTGILHHFLHKRWSFSISRHNRPSSINAIAFWTFVSSLEKHHPAAPPVTAQAPFPSYLHFQNWKRGTAFLWELSQGISSPHSHSTPQRSLLKVEYSQSTPWFLIWQLICTSSYSCCTSSSVSSWRSRGKPEPRALFTTQTHGDYYRHQYNDVLCFGFYSSLSCSLLFHLFFDSRWELSWFFHRTGTQRTCSCTARGSSEPIFCVKTGLFILHLQESCSSIQPEMHRSFYCPATQHHQIFLQFFIVSPLFYNSGSPLFRTKSYMIIRTYCWPSLHPAQCFPATSLRLFKVSWGEHWQRGLCQHNGHLQPRQVSPGPSALTTNKLWHYKTPGKC